MIIYEITQFKAYDAARAGDNKEAARLYALAAEQFPKTMGARRTKEFKRLEKFAATYAQAI